MWITTFEFTCGVCVGKSRLISDIYQCVNIRLNTIPGSDPTVIKVLLTAPTGKAEFGIGISQSSWELRRVDLDA